MLDVHIGYCLDLFQDPFSRLYQSLHPYSLTVGAGRSVQHKRLVLNHLATADGGYRLPTAAGPLLAVDVAQRQGLLVPAQHR